MNVLNSTDHRGSGRYRAEYEAGYQAGIGGKSITSRHSSRLHYLAGWQAGRASWLRSQSPVYGWTEHSLTRDRV